MSKILIVDDEAKIGKLLAAELGDEGHDCEHTDDSQRGLELVQSGKFDILLTDLRMPGVDGVTLLKETKLAAPGTDVIVMTAYASLETALETMRQGAYDYVIKPFKTEELLRLIQRLQERRQLQTENAGLKEYIATSSPDEIIGDGPGITRIKEMVAGLAKSDASVLVRGESGTGKELVARAIHKTSRRHEGPFIALNCAAIPDTLLESELFGYEKGAFTGANKKKVGHFQLAHGGTLFLDEIGDLPMALQAKLLRVLEDGKITPLGAESASQVDIRLVSATNKPLENDIQTGKFREDLFYRLNVFPIVLPPLRERKEDIKALSMFFLQEWGRNPEDLGDEAVARLRAYNWPGNIRELRNVLERALIIRAHGTIAASDILIADVSPGLPHNANFLDSLNLAEVEKQVIQRALDESNGNKSEAARLLGITRRALYGRLERYGME